MTASGKELEVKFALEDHARLKQELEALGARAVQPRVHEVNLRFDTPRGDLAAKGQVLRLRKDSEARLTYKGPGQVSEGVQSRTELEFTVGDFETAQRFLEALGFQLTVIYEKFRTTYALDRVLVALDEMPFGSFAEIEGPDGESIKNAADRLGLDWEKRIFEGYLALFARLKEERGWEFRDLTFKNFEGLGIGKKIDRETGGRGKTYAV